MAETFNDYPHNRHRALQIWQILIANADNRQTITYGMLSNMLGFGGAGVMDKMLGHIAAYCALHDLPLLNTLVVGRDSGVPTDGTLGRDPNEERERVFGFSWFRVYPPTPDALAEAFEEANSRNWEFD